MGKSRHSRKTSRRAVDKNVDDFEDSSEKSDERVFDYKKGPCPKGACHANPDVGCKEFENNTHACICTHDSRPPTRSGTCPRKTVPIVSGRIPNVQPPLNSITTTPNSTETAPVAPPPTVNFSLYLSVSFGILIAFILCVICIKCWRTRNKRLQNAEASPINLKHSLLIAERYAPNPQYSSCPGTGVPLIRNETLKFLSEIGEGCFGKVYKGELKVDNSDQVEIVAIKVLKESANTEAEENFLREVEIMSAFRHPYILPLLGVVLREGSVNPMMVFQYMPHGDLAELLRAQRRPPPLEGEAVPQLTDRDLLTVAQQIAGGMRYLAAQRFVHRDLACRNCLVAEGPTVKIADFGMSRDVYTCDYYKIGGSRLLPVRWMSPESVVYGRFTLESDIWSYGVVLWEIYSFGKQPYYGHSNEEVVKLILDGIMLIPPDDCPSLICELMKNCWKTEPRDRIKFASICDKLELALENHGLVQKQAANSSSMRYEDELKTKPLSSLSLNKNMQSLPRPPRLPDFSKKDAYDYDMQGYLLPREIKEPVHYLETLFD